MNAVKPFVKWIGGKTQLLSEIRNRYPDNIESYCEPFIGGGAVLFDVLSTFKPKSVMINDTNFELINVYNLIKNDVTSLMKALDELTTKYRDTKDKKSLYYDLRSKYNTLIKHYTNNDYIEKAALFIFLNKTCFNGLYRVNKNGELNASFNYAIDPKVYDKDNLLKMSTLLKNVYINCGSYEQCEDFIDKNTFVYLDPPYRPANGVGISNNYNIKNFDDESQLQLKSFIDTIHNKGAKFLASNSDPKHYNIEDNFFDDLYKDYKIERVYARRNVNRKGNGRGSITELLISN